MAKELLVEDVKAVMQEVVDAQLVDVESQIDDIKNDMKGFEEAKKSLFDELKTFVSEEIKGFKTSMKNEIIEQKNEEQKSDEKNEKSIGQYANLFYNMGKKSEPQKNEMEKGLAFARYVKLAVRNGNDPEKMYHDAKFLYGDSCPTFVKNMDPKNTKSFQTSSVPTEGGYLVQESYASEVIDLLYSNVFLFQAGAQRLPMDSGTISMPKYAVGSQSYWVGEGKPAVAVEHKFGLVTLREKRLVSLGILSNELIKNNSYQADMLIRDNMVREMSISLEYAALYGSGTEYTPMGLYNNPNVEYDTLGSVVTKTLPFEIEGRVASKNASGSTPGFVFNEVLKPQFMSLLDTGNFVFMEQMQKGYLAGAPFYSFNEIPVAVTANKPTDIFYGDWSAYMVGMDTSRMIIEYSKDASIESGSQVIRLFQNGLSAVKVTMHLDMAVKYPESFFIYKDVYTEA